MERAWDVDEPPRDPAVERMVDVVESAYYYLRCHPAADGTPSEAERRALLGHMERILGEAWGLPARPSPQKAQ